MGLRFVDETSAFQRGQLVGRRYRILRAIGQGGHACVYLAYDTLLQREVALKALMPSLRKTDVARRFAREARLLSRLKCPHVIDVQDFGTYWGVPWFVMGYLAGSMDLYSLMSRYREQGRHVPLSAIAPILRGIAHGIDRMHQLSIVHRDLKPMNILVTLEPEVHATVIDLGLAHDITASSQYTAKGEILGTLDYLAPEVQDEKRGNHLSDIFTFGIIAYELIAGKKPGHVYPLAVPSSLRLQAASLDSIIMRALARDPSDRFPSMAELRRALDDALFQPNWSLACETAEADAPPRLFEGNDVSSASCSAISLDPYVSEKMIWDSELEQKHFAWPTTAWALCVVVMMVLAIAAIVLVPSWSGIAATATTAPPAYGDHSEGRFVGPPAPPPVAFEHTPDRWRAKPIKPVLQKKRRRGRKPKNEETAPDTVVYVVEGHELTVPAGTELEVTIE